MEETDSCGEYVSTQQLICFSAFSCGAFISHKISALLKLTPHKLDETIIVEMAIGKTENTNEIHIGCTLILNRFSFKSISCPYLLVASTQSLTWTG